MEDFVLYILTMELLNIIGGTVRWLFGTLWRKIFNKPKFKFSEYLYGAKKEKNSFNDIAYEYNNRIIGVIFITIFIIQILR